MVVERRQEEMDLGRQQELPGLFLVWRLYMDQRLRLVDDSGIPTVEVEEVEAGMSAWTTYAWRCQINVTRYKRSSERLFHGVSARVSPAVCLYVTEENLREQWSRGMTKRTFGAKHGGRIRSTSQTSHHQREKYRQHWEEC